MAHRAGRAASFLTEHERGMVLKLAEAALPPGRRLAGADADTVRRAESFISELWPHSGAGYRAMLWALEAAAVPLAGGLFSRLPLGRRLQVLEAWRTGEATRLPLRALLAPLKMVHFDTAEAHAAAACRHVIEPPVSPETPRWREQVLDAGTLSADETYECDAVVVGTGAGGAPVAKELAERGLAVVMLEEGGLYTRRDFGGRPQELSKKLYRRRGFTLAYGNTGIPIPLGRAVGGTTTVNAGTCFRVPDRVLHAWREAGLDGFTPESMDEHYRRVEQLLGVAPARPEFVGEVGRLIARGCDALGWAHGPLPRNAPDCDGQGVCCFGCPTDAKRSTNVSYVPAALERNAFLLTGVRVERILVEGGAAVGVEGTATAPDGAARRVTVRAKAVVLACGALHTPALLLRNGLANGSGELGRNLSIHPATYALGVYDEPVEAWRSIPQGYCIEEFKDEGLLFEGATAPLDLTAGSLTGFGPAFVSLMEQYSHTLQFGFLVKDTSRGRVRPGRDGEPRITYWMNDTDLHQMRRGMALLARVLFASGAREVYPGVAGFERLRHPSEVDALAGADVAPRHFDITAYHPLGTARMGHDPHRSVVGPTHETHDVRNLYICDGSAVPTSLGVNPQLTIMALATRASAFIAQRIEELHARAAA